MPSKVYQNSKIIYHKSSNTMNMNKDRQLAKQPAAATGTENTVKPSKQGTKYNVKPLKTLVQERIKY